LARSGSLELQNHFLRLIFPQIALLFALSSKIKSADIY